MAQQEDKIIVPAGGAGLGAAVAQESGTELGQAEEQVRARGYWEQVWIRFRKDKVAIASGVFIILLILTAIFGAPLVKHWLGHGPDDIFPAPGVGVDNELVPRDPLTHAQN